MLEPSGLILMPEPYKVVSVEPGMAHVISRQDNENVGYVLLHVGSWGPFWAGYLPFDPDVSPTPRRVAIAPTRADCARSLWSVVAIAEAEKDRDEGPWG